MSTTSKIDFSLVLASSIHDMKNSVGMLMASLDEFVGAFPDLNMRQATHFNTLNYEASRINAELIQLLAFYKMQQGRLPLRLDQHYVIDVLEEQVAYNQLLLESKNIALKLKCSDKLVWFFDADLIGSIVQNIIVNCTRYTRSEILISAHVKDNFLHVMVADDGEGYPESMLEMPLSDDDFIEAYKGSTRLGLYFADQIVKMHRQNNRQGYIKLLNGAPLKGGCFNLLLP